LFAVGSYVHCKCDNIPKIRVVATTDH